MNGVDKALIFLVLIMAYIALGLAETVLLMRRQFIEQRREKASRGRRRPRRRRGPARARRLRRDDVVSVVLLADAADIPKRRSALLGRNARIASWTARRIRDVPATAPARGILALRSPLWPPASQRRPPGAAPPASRRGYHRPPARSRIARHFLAPGLALSADEPPSSSSTKAPQTAPISGPISDREIDEGAVGAPSLAAKARCVAGAELAGPSRGRRRRRRRRSP